MFGLGRQDGQLAALFQAITGGDRTKAEELLRADVTLSNTPAGKAVTQKVLNIRLGATALHVAAAAGQTALIETLLACKADINVQTSEGVTPLQAAAQGGHFDAAALLLDRGADAKTADSGKRTPLHAAASSGDEHVVQLLLTRGAEPQAQDDEGNTPLHTAARASNRGAVILLAKAGADVDARNSRNATPFMLAVIGGSSRARRVSAETALAVLDTLIKLKADVNAGDDSGEIPLDVLVARRTDPSLRPMMELLRRAGARCQKRDLPADLVAIEPPKPPPPPPPSPPRTERVVSLEPAPLYPRSVIIGAKPLLLGRHHTADVSFDHPTISLRHCRIDRRPGGVFIEDLESRNGVKINGVKTAGPHNLRPGDVLIIGAFHFQFDGGKIVPVPDDPRRNVAGNTTGTIG